MEILNKLNKTTTTDAYILNDCHLLINGSCLAHNLKHIYSRFKIDAVITDPPYGINLICGKGGKFSNYKPVHGDHNTIIAKQFYWQIIATYGVQNYALFGGNYFADFLPSERKWITWDKAMPEGMTLVGAEMIYTTFAKKPDVWHYAWSGSNIALEEREYKYKRFHPTQKPIGLLRRLIKHLPPSDGYIVDGFAGSCSLTWAAELEERKTICFELDRDYILRSIEVYQQLFPHAKIKQVQL